MRRGVRSVTAGRGRQRGVRTGLSRMVVHTNAAHVDSSQIKRMCITARAGWPVTTELSMWRPREAGGFTSQGLVLSGTGARPLQQASITRARLRILLPFLAVAGVSEWSVWTAASLRFRLRRRDTPCWQTATRDFVALGSLDGQQTDM